MTLVKEQIQRHFTRAQLDPRSAWTPRRPHLCVRQFLRRSRTDIEFHHSELRLAFQLFPEVPPRFIRTSTCQSPIVCGSHRAQLAATQPVEKHWPGIAGPVKLKPRFALRRLLSER